MHSTDAYAVLAKELEAMCSLPVADLVSLADKAPVTRELVIGHEPVELETLVVWLEPVRTLIRVTTHLRGPSTWHHQHMQESISISVPAGAAVGA